SNVRFRYVEEILPVAGNVKNHVLTFGEARQQVEKARKIIDTNWHNYKLTYLTPEEKLLVKQADAIKKHDDEVYASLESILSKQDMPALDALIKKEFSSQSPPFALKLNRLMELQVQVGETIFNNNNEIYKSATQKFFLLILLSLVVVVSLSVYIIRNVKHLIKDILKSSDVIKQSELRYRSLLENASDAIYVVDDKGNFTEVNESTCRMMGYSKRELLQLNVEDIVDPDQLKTDPVIHGNYLPDQSLTRERRLVRKDGEIIDVEIKVTMFADDKTLVIARDVTERKRAGELILREKELSETIINSLPGVFYLINAQHEYLRWNKNFETVTGYNKEEILKLTSKDLIVQEDISKVGEAVKKTFSEGYATVEAQAKIKDGSNIPFLLTGSPVMYENQLCLLGTGIDISSRIKAEDELKSSEQKYKLLFERNPSPLSMIAKDDLSIIAVNDAAANLYGYTRDELLRSSATIVRPKEDLEQQRLNFQAPVNEPTDRGIIRHVKKDGTLIFVNVVVSDMVFEGRAVRLVLTTDVTEKLIAEEELRSSEQKYKLIFESNPSPLWMVAKDDLSIIAVNETAVDLYGYTKNELLNMSVKELRPPDELDEQLQIFREEFVDSTDLGIVRQVKKDGTIFSVQLIAHDIVFEGRPVRLSLTTDVTESLKAEELLRKSEANLKTIMDTTDTAYALLDENLNVMAFNQMAIKFVNSQYNHNPSKGDSLADYFPTERFPQFINYAGEVLKGKNISYEINYPQVDGSVLWFYTRLFPITNDKNEIFGLMLALSDITERKNSEDNLKVAYERIQDHITSIKDMAWKQSHLIRSPLANLKGLAAMLADNPSDDEILKYLQTELERLDRVIIDMAEDASIHDDA
ncbi:MAG: PAS domain S-box protein, partial [Mucilaginibacter sp.]